VRHLIAIGQDLGLPTCDELEAFLEHGLEDAVMFGAPMKRIRGTGRVFPAIAGFDELRLRERLSFSYLGRLSSESLPSELMGRLRELPSDDEEGSSVPERLRVDLDAAGEGKGLRRPSQPTAHQVVRRRPLDCWEELVVRAVRFGRPVTLSNGPRLELLGAKAVVTEPARESRHALERYGFQLESLLDYGTRMLRAELPEDTSYTYGNRLRGHFRKEDKQIDTLQEKIGRLRTNHEKRKR
jgi:thymidylate synthase